MSAQPPVRQSTLPAVAVQRLTAVWALSEAGVGGVLHALHLPVTGLLVGGSAVLFITLLAFFAPDRKTILRATVVVLLIKAMVSPHSPVGAYVAVAFQGVMGWLLFSTFRNIRFAALLLGIITLLESALQRLLMLTLLFGKPFWQAVDAFGKSVVQWFGYQEVSVSLSQWLIGGYLSIHLLAGMGLGWLAGKLPGWIANELRREPTLLLPDGISNLPPSLRSPQPWWKTRSVWLTIAFAVIVALAVWLLPLNSPDAGWQAGLVLLRALLIITLWYALVAPLLLRAFRAFLRKRASAYADDVAGVLAMLPLLRTVFVQSWQQSARATGWPRYRKFLITFLTAALTVRPAEPV